MISTRRAQLADGGKRPSTWIEQFRGVASPTSYQHLAVSQQGCGVADAHGSLITTAMRSSGLEQVPLTSGFRGRVAVCARYPPKMREGTGTLRYRIRSVTSRNNNLRSYGRGPLNCCS